MTFGEAIQSAFSNYVNFSGRAQRIVVSILDLSIFGTESYTPLSTLWTLGTLLPALAVSARRLHDINRSGWWILLSFIPIVGIIILIIWWAKPGEPGANRFGMNPLG
jgi:uncharacterized membrane protein YhaH (DUF805 family)